jgi:hypothetical protein
MYYVSSLTTSFHEGITRVQALRTHCCLPSTARAPILQPRLRVHKPPPITSSIAVWYSIWSVALFLRLRAFGFI